MVSRLDDIRRRCRRFGFTLPVVVAVTAVGISGRSTVSPIAPAIAPAPRAAVAPPQPAIDPPAPAPVVRRPQLTTRVISNGAPLAGAAVSITDGSRPALATARSDRDGVVQFPELAPGAYEIWATAPTGASPILRLAELTADVTTELVLGPASRVSGQLNVDGPVPAGSTVQLVPRDLDHVVHVALVDEAGRFVLDGVPYGHWRVESTVPGFVQTADQILHVTEDASALAIRTVRAGSVSGTVVDSAGAPVANATIVLREQAGSASTTQRPFNLGPSEVRWVHPLAGTRLLPVNDSSRFGASRPGSRPAECGRGHCGLDLGRIRGTTVHAMADGEVASIFAENRTEAGRVVSIEHGGGLKTFYMHLDEIRPGLEVGQPIRAGDPVGTLGSTGFTRSLPHLHFALTHERGGRTWYLDPEPLLRHAVVLPMQRALEPVDAAIATTRERLRMPPAVSRFTTDAQGAFRIDGVAPGSFVAAAFGSELAPGASAGFVVRSGEATTGVTITLRAGVLLTGRVLGRDGPIAGATILASAGLGETAHKVARAMTDRHGEFTVRSLSGKITLGVTAPGHGETSRTITLDDVRIQRREEFKLTIENAQLRGQVLDPEGGAAGGVTVRVVDGPTRRTAITDAQGRFVLERMANGRYVIELASPSFPSKRATLESDRWSELRLDAGGGARAMIRDAHSRGPLAAVRVELVGPGGQTLARTTDARGIVELRGLAAGDWKLAATAPGYVRAHETVTIRIGRVLQDVALELARGATLAGVVRDRHGRRVAGAKVRLGTASTITDADGNFRLTDVPTGRGVLEAEYADQHGDLTLDLTPASERLSLAVELTD